MNTVYFKGTWALPFPEAETCEEPFYLDGGGEVPVPLMQERIDVRHLQDEGFQAVELTYRGDALSLLVLLPDKKDGLPDLEARLSARMLRDHVAAMTVREVDVFLPRFELGSALDLEAALSDLGMPLPFTLAADFSGMNGRTPPHRGALHISAVRHQAVVEVNEEGTEAAAATAVTMVMLGGLRTTATPTPVFRADHPFLFAIRDRKSGALLFLGRVVDPTRG